MLHVDIIYVSGGVIKGVMKYGIRYWIGLRHVTHCRYEHSVDHRPRRPARLRRVGAADDAGSRRAAARPAWRQAGRLSGIGPGDPSGPAVGRGWRRTHPVARRSHDRTSVVEGKGVS